MNLKRHQPRFTSITRPTLTVLASLLMIQVCFAQNSLQNSDEIVEEIVVIGITPAGAGIDKEKIPFPIQTADARMLENSNATSIADFLKQNFSSISLNDAQNNPLQPDLQYRGFTASPLLGLAQGLAVYQNGIRINEPLGDAVNWDLLPQSAIQDITLMGGG